VGKKWRSDVVESDPSLNVQVQFENVRRPPRAAIPSLVGHCIGLRQSPAEKLTIVSAASWPAEDDRLRPTAVLRPFRRQRILLPTP
jgi:hypothetical protein